MKEQFIHIDANGNKFYYQDKEMTKLHREDGPAFESPSGNKEWRLNGKLHREDGPAIEWASGNKEWYLNGKRLSQEHHACRNQKEIVLTLNEIADKFGIDVSKLKIKK